MFDRILVPLDGSKVAEQVFPYVTELATAFGSDVISIGICEPEESEYGHICHVYMNNEADLLKTRIGTDKVKSVVLSGRPADEILDYAEKHEVSLVVMASHGRSGIKPWSLGSTVEKVLHRIAAPLLIIRASEKPAEPGKTGLFKRILAPLDGSEACETVLPYITELMKKLGSEVTLLQVLASGKHVHTVGGIDYVYFKDHDRNSMEAKAKEYLDKAGAKLDSTKAVRKCELKFGDPAEEIARLAEEARCDLIVTGGHGHRWLGDLFHGATVNNLRHVTDIPVLTLRVASPRWPLKASTGTESNG